MGDYILDFDYRLFRLLNGLAGRAEAWDFTFVSLAEGIVYLMGSLLIVFVFLELRSRKQRLVVALEAVFSALLGRLVIMSFIRAMFFRPRPFISGIVEQLVWHNPLEGSFPSGHATVMFAAAFTLLFYNTGWGIFYLALAILSALARVVTGVHFPLDIAAGVFIGALSSFLARWIFDFWVRKKKRQVLPRRL